MHGIGRRATVSVLSLALASLVVGCRDEPGADAPGASTSSVSDTRAASGRAEGSVPYALLDSGGWTLDDAVDWPPDHVLADIEPVPSDWWAEYQRLEPTASGTEGLAVKLTGLAVGLDDYRVAMERLGFSFDPVDTPSGPGLTGTTDEQGARPVILAVPLGGGTLELLSYELSSEELVALADDVHTVDEAEWRAAGGTVG